MADSFGAEVSFGRVASSCDSSSLAVVFESSSADQKTRFVSPSLREKERERDEEA